MYFKKYTSHRQEPCSSVLGVVSVMEQLGRKIKKLTNKKSQNDCRQVRTSERGRVKYNSVHQSPVFIHQLLASSGWWLSRDVNSITHRLDKHPQGSHQAGVTSCVQECWCWVRTAPAVPSGDAQAGPMGPSVLRLTENISLQLHLEQWLPNPICQDPWA